MLAAVNIFDLAKILTFAGLALLALQAVGMGAAFLILPFFGLLNTSFWWVNLIFLSFGLWTLRPVLSAPRGERVRAARPFLGLWAAALVVSLVIMMPIHNARDARGEVARLILEERHAGANGTHVWSANYRTMFLQELWPAEIRTAAEITELNVGGSGQVIATYETRTTNLGRREEIQVRGSVTVPRSDPRYRSDAPEVFLASP